MVPLNYVRTFQHTLTQNSAINVLPGGNARRHLIVMNEHATANAYLHFIRNPWCVSFDGTGDFISADGILGNAAYMAAATGSIGAEVKVTDTAGIKTIFSISDAAADTVLKLAVTASEILQATLRVAGTAQWTLNTSAAIDETTRAWLDVKLVQDGVEPRLYVNGNLVPQTFAVTTDKTAWVSQVTGATSVRIGANNVSGATESDFFVGKIKEVNIYHGLNPDAEHVNRSRTLVARYLNDEGTGVTSADISGNGYDGTLTNATWALIDDGLLLEPAKSTYFTDLFQWNLPLWIYTTATPHTVRVTEGR